MKKLSPLSPPVKGHVEVTSRDFGTTDKMIVSRWIDRNASARLICELDRANEFYTVREFDGESWSEVTTRTDEKPKYDPMLGEMCDSIYETDNDAKAMRPIEHTVAYAWLINSLAEQEDCQCAVETLIAALSDAGMEPYRLVALIHVLDSFVTQDMPID